MRFGCGACRSSIRPKRYCAAGICAILVGCLCLSGLAKADLISVGGGNSLVEVTAEDRWAGDQSGMGLKVRRVIAIPLTAAIEATNGRASNSAQLELDAQRLSVSHQGQLSGAGPSSAELFGDLWFSSRYDLHYEVSGSLQVSVPDADGSDNTTWVTMRAALRRADGATFYSGDSYIFVPPHTTVRQDYASLPEMVGATSGTLFAGPVYEFQFSNLVDLMFGPTAVVGPSSTGVVALALSVLGDLNNDRSVGFDDLLSLAQHYGRPANYAQGDINGDGKVTFTDLLTLSQRFGQSVPAGAATASPVPEPGAVAAVVLLGPIARPRRRASLPSRGLPPRRRNGATLSSAPTPPGSSEMARACPFNRAAALTSRS